jgi:hypothetical protein
MYQSVQDAFFPMSKRFEGYLPFMYVDIKGLVTTGMGNLIDPVENALNLPWKHSDGSPASQQEIMAAFNTVKHSGMNMAGGGNQGRLTNIRLDEDGIRQLISMKLTNNETILRHRIPKWDSLPADVQLVLLSMAWAMGPSFVYPKFLSYINQAVPDFKAAASECYMPDNPQRSLAYPPTTNPGLRPRNLTNRQLLLNADQAVSSGAALDQLYVPIDDVLAGITGLAKGILTAQVQTAQMAVHVTKKNPLAVGSLVLVLAGGTYVLANKKWG